MTYTGIINSLDLKKIFVDNVAGGWDIFFFVALIFFAYLSARFKMPNSIFLLLMGLFIVMMAGVAGYTLLYTLLIFLAGLFIYYVISKIPKS